ncbi:hypothetical protein L2E82_28478 [Cichorium intybus]|uniref:Uncharacterized protein n=1 Tax=Cichorium intybus TaxID=13427 RepID=A0ACB9CW80_CICIN|nr:hypothetical protein L2E82_28478 [Cichorium intybus]
MLEVGVDHPSRFELLSAVKKHSTLIGKAIEDEEDTSHIDMNQKFWHDVMDLYFMGGRESKEQQDDDLLFFVTKMSLQVNDNMGETSPYFVRRWATKLDDLVGGSMMIVDWRRSLYLNLIAHTSYSLTVAICSHESLQNHLSNQQEQLSPIYKIVKNVYASPSRVHFHLDSRKEVETSPAYPDICFAVDDFDSTFEAVVLTNADHCYCVVLNAVGGAAFPSEKLLEDNTIEINKRKLTLFSGFVSYQAVRDAYDDGKSVFESLLSFGHSSSKKANRIYMTGPNGCGEVEVAVSGVTGQNIDESGSPSGFHISWDFGIRAIVRNATAVAEVAAKNVLAIVSSKGNSEGETLPLRCCLMSISLPWEHIANDLLFKGSPPVNL